MQSEAGQLARRALLVDNAKQLGITITLNDILADELAALKILESERDRLERERQKRPPDANVPNKNQ